MTSPDYIVSFPYSSNVSLEAGEITPYLSVPSQMAGWAAVHLWRQHSEAMVVVPGESGYGSHLPDTSDLMKNLMQAEAGMPYGAIHDLHFTRRTPHVPLNNSWLQAQTAVDYIQASATPQGNATFLALEFHVPRARQAVRSAGSQAGVVSVESVLREAGDDRFDDYMPHLAQFGRLEPLLRVAGRMALGRKLINAGTRIRGAQIIDLARDDSGDIVAEATTASRKLQQLRAARAAGLSANAHTVRS